MYISALNYPKYYYINLYSTDDGQALESNTLKSGADTPIIRGQNELGVAIFFNTGAIACEGRTGHQIIGTYRYGLTVTTLLFAKE